MDQIKIGAFLKTIRKEKNLTQQELADKLNVSFKTISKWECGKGVPDVSLMPLLCETLNISINELFCGEKLNEENYSKKIEENVIAVLDEKNRNTKKMIATVILGVSSVSITLIYFILLSYLDVKEYVKNILIVAGLIILLAICISLCILDNDIGYFQCKHCKHHFVPKTIDYIKAPHTLIKRKLKCPKCGKISYCKKILSKPKGD